MEYGDAGATNVSIVLHFYASSWTDDVVPHIRDWHHELNLVSASAAENACALRASGKELGEEIKEVLRVGFAVGVEVGASAKEGRDEVEEVL